MSYADPEPADGRWKVIYRGAFFAWYDQQPLLGAIGAVTEWIRSCELLGPPAEALLVDEGEICRITIPGSDVAVEFLVVTYERLIIVRSFGTAASD